MKAPDKIYLTLNTWDDGKGEPFSAWSWCQRNPDKGDVAYLNAEKVKDAVINYLGYTNSQFTSSEVNQFEKWFKREFDL